MLYIEEWQRFHLNEELIPFNQNEVTGNKRPERTGAHHLSLT
jgi:hypothetical protein